MNSWQTVVGFLLITVNLCLTGLTLYSIRQERQDQFLQGMIFQAQQMNKLIIKEMK